MAAAELLVALRERGLTLSSDGEVLVVRPRDLLTDELRAAIQAQKPAILAELATAANDGVEFEAQPEPGIERRCSRALALLTADPTLQRVYVLEGGDPMILGVALRGIAYGQLEIRADRCDLRSLLALLDEHCQPQTLSTADGALESARLSCKGST